MPRVERKRAKSQSPLKNLASACPAMPRAKAKSPDPGVSPPSGRTVPEWMDPKGEHGELIVLLMEPLNRERKLPSNPFIVARSIKEEVGTIAAAYRDRDGNLVVKVRCPKKAAKLKQMRKLIDGSEVKVTEHARLNQVRCIVTCHSVAELKDEELVEEMADQGVLEVRRIGKGSPRSATMIITLRGTVVPSELHFGYDLCRTREYRQAPMQCYKCYDFGHTKARCPAKTAELCRNCSEPHTIKKDEQGRTVCTAPAHCKNCDGSHSPTSRVCPKYREEEVIEDIRKKEDVSPREARRLFEERRSAAAGDSYASVASNEKALAAMRKELEAAQTENEVLRRKELDAVQKEDEKKELEKKLASYQRKLQRAKDKIAYLKAKEEKRAAVTASKMETEENQSQDEEEEADDEEDENEEEEEEEEEEENEDENDEEEEEEEEEEDEGNEDSCPEPIKRHRSESSVESNGSNGAKKAGKTIPNANNKINEKTIAKINEKNTDKNQPSDWQKVSGPKNKQNKRRKH